MKKKITALSIAMMLVASLTACGGSKGGGVATPDPNDPNIVNAVQEVENPDEIKDAIGIDMSVDKELNSEDETPKYSIISKSIGETTFTVDGVTYDYRACKDLIGDAMAGIESAMDENTTSVTLEDVETQFSTYDDGTLIAFWTIGQMNFSLTCKDTDQDTLKSVATSLIKDAKDGGVENIQLPENDEE